MTWQLLTAGLVLASAIAPVDTRSSITATPRSSPSPANPIAG